MGDAAPFARRLIRRARRLIAERLAVVNRRPLIVLGKEKSGTTAIAALLGEATGLTVTLDIPALFIDGLRPILRGEAELAELIARQRLAFSRDIIKEPNLTYIAGQARACFPEARMVAIVRDPRANIRSVFNRMGIRGDLMELPREAIAGIPAGWRWHFDEPALLGLAGGDYIALAAQRWNRAAEPVLAADSSMTVIRYEDFVADRVGAIERLAERLGLRVVRDIGDDATRQFQPLGADRDCPWSDFFGERNLATIERICGPAMARFDYSTG
ncbi:MAG: sulfotransferase [Sphingomicrobium sp.]